MYLNKNYMALSFLATILISFIIPSKFFTYGGMGTYKFGLPFSFIEIHQHEANSMWLGSNFFAGNAGISVNPLIFIVNAFIIYLIALFISRKFKRLNIKKANYS